METIDSRIFIAFEIFFYLGEILISSVQTAISLLFD